MEAPEKIYVPTAGDELHYHMACPNNEFQESIEYTRTDAFIEKAVKFLKEWDAYRVCLEGHKDWFIEQFKKYMENE